MHNDQNNLSSHNYRANKKDPRHCISRRNGNLNVHFQNSEKYSEKDGNITTKNGLHIRKTRSDRTSIIVTSTAIDNPKEVITKSKFQVSSLKPLPLKERPHKQKTRQMKVLDNEPGKVPKTLSSLTSVCTQRQESIKQMAQQEPETCKPSNTDTDSGSDLSETEKVSRPLSTIAPSQLHLREEVIDPLDSQPSRHLSRSKTVSSDSYPDYLPPPFNSWNLQHLAVYLNTDGRGMHRLRSVGQLERYLERLLQLEWHQIQTVHEENNKSSWMGRHRPHSTPHSSLSAPKSILQCQRAFPLALLSSFTNTRGRGTCRLFMCTQHSHLSPLPEKYRKTPRIPRRSNSESRAHLFSLQITPRFSDPDTSYLKHMQATGNIRNPGGFTCDLQCVLANTYRDLSRKTGPGGRSRSCGDVSKDTYRRARPEKRTAVQHLQPLRASTSNDLHSCKESVGIQKHVDFVTY